jgi:hypothetical protein
MTKKKIGKKSKRTPKKIDVLGLGAVFDGMSDSFSGNYRRKKKKK